VLSSARLSREYFYLASDQLWGGGGGAGWGCGERPFRQLGLYTAMLQLGDVVAECGVPGREVIARCPGLARWRSTPSDTGREECH